MTLTAETLMQFAIPVFFLLIGLELIVGIILNRQIYRFNDALANISCGIVQQVSGLIFKLAGLSLYVYLYSFKIFEIPNNWLTYIILFVLIDMLYYWFHRFSHEINTLWGAHVVHHQSEDYNLSVALRQSSFQSFFSFAFYLPLSIIGFDPVPFAIVSTIQTLYQFWIHTETIHKMPFWFEYIFNTPSHHRVHHGRNPEYIDKNHGGTLIIFDRLFGTFEPEKSEVVYGVTKPLSSWNPIWANFDYYIDLFKTTISIPKVKDKISLWVKRPGWLPAELGGIQQIPEISRKKQIKYGTSTASWFIFYALIQYLAVLAITITFLIIAAKVLFIHSLVLAALILWSVGNLGVLSDKKHYGVFLEFLRLLTAPIIICMVSELRLLTIPFIIFSVLSIIYLTIFFNKASRN